MPRPERPVDPSAGPVERFAAALRKLRSEAGGPPYREMAKAVHVSKASLSAAASGHRLPTWEVTKGYVGACGGDIEDWHARWSAVRDEVAPAVSTRIEPLPVPLKRRARRYVLPVVALGAVVLLGGAFAAWRLGGRPAASLEPSLASPVPGVTASPALGPPVPLALGTQGGPAIGDPASAQSTARFVGGAEQVADNGDPKKTGCADDPSTIETLDRVQVNTINENLLGVAVLRHSPSCHASWGRFEPSPRLTYLSGPVRVTIFAHRPATGTVGAEYTTAFDGQAVFGNILLDDSGCVEITVLVDAPDGGGSATTACKR